MIEPVLANDGEPNLTEDGGYSRIATTADY